MNKKGLIGASYSDLDRLGASWYTKWTNSNSSSDLAHSEYVPMLWAGEIDENISQGYSGPIIFLNEPDLPGQANISPEDAVDLLEAAREYYPNAWFVFGGCSSECSEEDELTTSYEWVEAALDYMEEEEIGFPEAWHLHIYMFGWDDEIKWDHFEEMIDVINDHYGDEDTPIWVTEFGCAFGQLDNLFRLYNRITKIPQVVHYSPWLTKAADDVQEESWWPKYGNGDPWPLDYGRLIDSTDDLITAAGYLFKNYQNQITGEEGMLTRIFHDDFVGLELENFWREYTSGTGSVEIADDAPSRVVLSSGVSSGGNATIDWYDHHQFSPSEALTMIARVKIDGEENRTTDIGFFDPTAAERAFFRLDEEIRLLTKSSSGWNIQVIEDAIVDEWILLEMVVTDEYVRARVNGGDITEALTNIPSNDMRFSTQNISYANGEKVLEIDFITILPGYAAF